MMDHGLIYFLLGAQIGVLIWVNILHYKILKLQDKIQSVVNVMMEE